MPPQRCPVCRLFAAPASIRFLGTACNFQEPCVGGRLSTRSSPRKAYERAPSTASGRFGKAVEGMTTILGSAGIPAGAFSKEASHPATLLLPERESLAEQPARWRGDSALPGAR